MTDRVIRTNRDLELNKFHDMQRTVDKLQVHIKILQSN